MGFFDSVTAPTNSAPATPTVGVAPEPSSPIPQASGSFFSGIDSLPSPSNSPAPSKDQTSKGGFFDDIKAPSEVKDTSDKGGIPSPYFSGPTKEGGMIGFSVTKDSSGKPLFAYRNPGDAATTTDPTRVATTFDPRVPQKMSSDDFYNPRAVANRAALKTAMGGTYNDELDHKIALELSGSNQPENLQIEPFVPGTKNTATDPLENSLAKDVANGKVSLFDAQKQLAKAKGIDIPWTGEENKPGIWQDIKDFFNGVSSKVHDLFGTTVHASTDMNHPALSGQITNPPDTLGGVEIGKGSVTNASSLDVYDSKGNYVKTFTGPTAGKDANSFVDNMNSNNMTPLEKEGEALRNESEAVDKTDKKSIDDFNAKVVNYNARLNSSNEPASGKATVTPSNPFGTFGRMVSAISDTTTKTVQDAANRLTDFIETAGDKNSSTLDRMTKLSGAVVGGLNVAFLPLTVAIAAGKSSTPGPQMGGKQLPSLQSLSSGISDLFQKVGEGSKWEVKQGLDALPLSNETKVKIEPALMELASLVNSIALGKVADTAIHTELGDKVQQIGKIIEAEYKTMKELPNKQGGFIGIGKKEPVEPIKPEENKIIPPELKSLAIEAKKYKTADDFIKSQGITLLHGTRENFENFDISKAGKTDSGFAGKGIYFTNDRKSADFFSKGQGDFKSGGRVVESIVDIKNPLRIEPSKNYNSYEEILKRLGIEKKDDIPAKLKEKGYDGIIIEDKDSSGNPVNEYVVHDTSKIKSKAQLIDIYNKATQSKSEKEIRTLKMGDKEIKVVKGQSLDIPAKKPPVFSEEKGGVIHLNDEHYHNDLVGDLVNHKNSDALSNLEQRGQQLEFKQEALKNNPASKLAKFDKGNGLGEVTGEKGGIWKSMGDEKASELGFSSTEHARGEYEKYKVQKAKFTDEMKSFKEAKKSLTEKFKTDSIINGPGRPPGDYDPEILQANGGIAPPVVRGGLQAPEVNWQEFEDKAAIRLGRDTMERNLEKVAGPHADELKDFLVEPIRQNEVDRIHYATDIRNEIKQKINEWGIKRGSKEDELIQLFGEKKISLTELQKATPKWKEVQSATDYFSKLYGRMLDDWNAKRTKFQYQPVPKRPDYFRHFNDINEWTNTFGFLRKEGQLPTAIAGMTAFFKPGKPFSTAELHRTGDLTSYSAIGGMDNYIDSVSKQAFHIDSIQRGRALEKYLQQAATAQPKINLPNFIQNISEYTNLVSGKAAMLDRSIEATVGRPVMKFLKTLSNLVARNIIVGNVSVAMTHLVSMPLNLATVDKVPFIRGMYKTLVSPLLNEPINHIDGIESSFLTRRFPEKYIQPTKFNKTVDILSTVFTLTDQFKSKLTVASKYYEGISKGLEPQEAMKEADKYAGRIVGDYSIGNRPNLMNTHTMQLLAQFQLGVNDGLSVLMHDIPHWEEGNKSKIAGRLFAFMIFSFLFNQIYKKIRGSGKGIDPLDAGLTITGMNDEGAGQDFFSRLQMAGGDIAGELPFTSIFAGSFPLATSVGQPIYNAITGKSDRLKAGETLASNVISPVGGGTQAKKMIEGISAVNKGQTTTSTGSTNVPLEKTPFNYVKGAIFGPSAFNNANGNNKETSKLVNILNAGKGQATAQAEAKFNEMKQMPKAQAEKAFLDLQKSDPALAKHIIQISDDEKAGVSLNERLIKSLGVVNGERAKYIANMINALPDSKSKATLWDRYINIHIISPQVSEQLAPLIKK